MKLGIEEARGLFSVNLLPGHILLGLADDGEGMAAGILEGAGMMPLSMIRPKVLRVLRLGPAAQVAEEALDSLTRLANFFDDPAEDLAGKLYIKAVLDRACRFASRQPRRI